MGEGHRRQDHIRTPQIWGKIVDKAATFDVRPRQIVGRIGPDKLKDYIRPLFHYGWQDISHHVARRLPIRLAAKTSDE
jgi:hypothetical protein